MCDCCISACFPILTFWWRRSPVKLSHLISDKRFETKSWGMLINFILGIIWYPGIFYWTIFRVAATSYIPDSIFHPIPLFLCWKLHYVFYEWILISTFELISNGNVTLKCIFLWQFLLFSKGSWLDRADTWPVNTFTNLTRIKQAPWMQ